MLQKQNRPTIMQLPFVVGAYSGSPAAADCEVAIPTDGHYAAFGISLDAKARLFDQHALKLEHDDYNAIDSDASGTGVPLGHVASWITHGALDGTGYDPGADLPFAPWPGRLNDPLAVLKRIARGQRSAEDDLRLQLCDWLPISKPLTLWPLKGGKNVKLRVSRAYGAESVSELYLWVVRLPEPVHRKLCDSRQFVDYPRWYARFFDLASTEGEDTIDKMIRFGGGYGFRWLQTFAMGYNNNGGTVTYDETALNTLLVQFSLIQQGDLLPNIAGDPRRAALLMPQLLQLHNPLLDPGIVLPDREQIRANVSRDASAANDRDVYVSYYGLLRPQDRNGFIQDTE